MQNPVLQPVVCDWTDDGSGIEFVRYELHLMQVNNDQLAEFQDPEITFDDYNVSRSIYSVVCCTIIAIYNRY